MTTIEKEKLYTKYLLTEPKRASWLKISNIMWIEKKQINRFLLDHCNEPKQVFDAVKQHIDLEWWVFSIDDQVEDKEFSRIWKWDLVGKFWSWRHHDVVIWINLVTLYYTDKKWVRVPINRRVVDKTDWKTKNDYFMEMLVESFTWWIRPSMITGDCWYWSAANCNFITWQWIGFLFWIKTNRKVKIWVDWYKNLSECIIPKEWVIGYIKDIGYAVIFEQQGNFYMYRDHYKTNDKDKALEWIKRRDFEIIHAKHWHIEEYHRALKQLCNVDKHFLRNKNCVLTHIYCSIKAYCILEINRMLWKFQNIYDLARENLKQYISQLMSSQELDELIFF